jgi:hypothetical protein
MPAPLELADPIVPLSHNRLQIRRDIVKVPVNAVRVGVFKALRHAFHVAALLKVTMITVICVIKSGAG